jgi:hypothetical protein
MPFRRPAAMQSKWTGKPEDESPADSPALPSTGELNTTIQSIREMGYTPVNRMAVTHIVIAAGLPLLPVVLTLVPLGNLIKWALGKFL